MQHAIMLTATGTEVTALTVAKTTRARTLGLPLTQAAEHVHKGVQTRGSQIVFVTRRATHPSAEWTLGIAELTQLYVWH